MFTVKSEGKEQATATTLKGALNSANNAHLMGLENITIKPYRGMTIFYSSTTKKDEK